METLCQTTKGDGGMERTAQTGGEQDRGMPGSFPVGSFRFLYTLWTQYSLVAVHDVALGLRRTVCEQGATTA